MSKKEKKIHTFFHRFLQDHTVCRMSPKPAFFIVCGDLVDAFPDKWPEIRTAQEKDFFKVFSKLNSDIPLVCVCGNHDVGKSFIFNFSDTVFPHIYIVSALE